MGRLLYVTISVIRDAFAHLIAASGGAIPHI